MHTRLLCFQTDMGGRGLFSFFPIIPFLVIMWEAFITILDLIAYLHLIIQSYNTIVST